MHEKQALFPEVRSCTVVTLVHACDAVKLLRDKAQSLLYPVPSFPAKLLVKNGKERGEVKRRVCWWWCLRGLV